jgi:hypothetical protein
VLITADFWAIVHFYPLRPVRCAGSDGVNRGIRSLAVRVGVTALTLCAIGCGVSAGREEAEALAEQYFTKIQSGDIESVLSLYSAKFYAVTSRADWSALLQEQRARCGTPKTHTLVSWNVVSSFGTNSGTRTTLVYDVEYSNCRMSEKITVFKPSGGKIQIHGHLLKPETGNRNDKADSQTTLKT